MLKVENVSKVYSNNRGIKNISFNLKPKEIIGVLGENGSGKSTLFKSLLSLKEIDGGIINYDNQDLNDLDMNTFGYLSEERSLYPDLTVYQQIRHLGLLRGISENRIENEIDYWLEKLKITQYKDTRIRELSKGNQQKVQFIISIIHDPDILILDEPLSGLDVINANLLKEIIIELAKKNKMILLSSHQFEHIEGLFDKVLILKDGECVYYGNTEQLKKSSEHRYISLMTSDIKDYFLEDGVIHESICGQQVRLLMENKDKAYRLFNRLLYDDSLTSLTIELPTLKDIVVERDLL